MSILIKTEYRSDVTGRGKVTAKGGGKQATVPYVDGYATRSHAEAAAAVAVKLGLMDVTGAWEIPGDKFYFKVQ